MPISTRYHKAKLWPLNINSGNTVYAIGNSSRQLFRLKWLTLCQCDHKKAKTGNPALIHYNGNCSSCHLRNFTPLLGLAKPDWFIRRSNVTGLHVILLSQELTIGNSGVGISRIGMKMLNYTYVIQIYNRKTPNVATVPLTLAMCIRLEKENSLRLPTVNKYAKPC